MKKLIKISTIYMYIIYNPLTGTAASRVIRPGLAQRSILPAGGHLGLKCCNTAATPRRARTVVVVVAAVAVAEVVVVVAVVCRVVVVAAVGKHKGQVRASQWDVDWAFHGSHHGAGSLREGKVSQDELQCTRLYQIETTLS